MKKTNKRAFEREQREIENKEKNDELWKKIK
jgi:hypothetical protein